ncbi:hypothetical protein HG536_0G02070 [Torulaspora globosa]|uniref:Uncharacterized protein n=1 Tax=Torulaspora globosa TaxID=48254 RepID=A0A7G3ZLG2_9SACH|nr:uncharacterized protein HG536_0G02070 [Torulaspora globosa]QLL34348.1 hypothetical protein HG536_0G02070 [Torulaspora globosa]
MLDQDSNSDGDLKLQDSSEEIIGPQDSIANPQLPPLEDYHIREDDDDITSSDEDTEGHRDSSFRSWFSRSRHHKPISESVSPVKLDPSSSSECAIAEGTPNRSGSSSSFRKGFRSLFRRDSGNEDVLTETPKDGLSKSDDEKGTGEDNEGLPETSTNSKFWRSWRSGHHHHHRHRHRHSPEACEPMCTGGEADPETLRNPSLDVGSMISHEEKRQKNMAKLADQLEDISANPSPERDLVRPDNVSTPEQKSSDVESTQSDASTSSSVERALNVRERVGLVFSASSADNGRQKQEEISPLTPPGDVLENPYKYVFDQKDDPISILAQDATLLYKYCKTFDNFDSALKLLTRNAKGLNFSDDHSSMTLSEISNEVLDFIRHEMLSHDRSVKKNEVMASDLTSLQKQIESLRADCEAKDAKSAGLQEALNAANVKIRKMGDDLEEAAQEVDMLAQEVESYKGQIQEIKLHERKAIEESEIKIAQINEDKESSLKDNTEVLKENTFLKERIDELEKEHKALIFDHEMLQEKHSTTTARLADLVGSYNKGQGQERNMRDNLEATGTKLRRYENTIEILKIGNLKIQENFHRERRKVLDLRQEVNYLRKQLQFIECHRSQSLQFMSHLMFYYRGIVTDDTLAEYDVYLKKLSASDFLPRTVHLTDDEMKAHFKEREALVVKFYNDIAKRSFLDQVVSKHVSYMRSNKFLSSQLAGLRKHIDEYEQYVGRLLKEILTHKNLEEKNEQKIALLKEKNNEYKSKLSQIAN